MSAALTAGFQNSMHFQPSRIMRSNSNTFLENEK